MTTISVNANRHAAEAPKRRGGRSMAGEKAGPVTYVVLTVAALLFIFPFYYSIVAASHTDAEIFSDNPPIIPGTELLANMRSALEARNLFTALGRSLLVSGVVTLSTVLFCTVAGFAFAKLRFRGRGPLFGVTLATLTIPPTLSLIPLYQIMSKLHLIDNLFALILPAAVTAFGVFFMRQFVTQAVPDELIEAARVDGATMTRTVISIVLPIVRPGMAVLGILAFMTTWNDFVWPLTAVPNHPTVQVAIAGVSTGYNAQQSIILAGSIIATVPLIIVTAIFGKQIVGGIMAGAVKG